MGWAVAFMGPIAGTDVDAFVVGAQRGDTGGNLSGSAYIYAADCFWKNYCVLSPNSVGAIAPSESIESLQARRISRVIRFACRYQNLDSSLAFTDALPGRF